MATHREKSCTGKLQRPKTIAEEAAERMGWPYQAYKCLYCPFWHIGKKPGYLSEPKPIDPKVIDFNDAHDWDPRQDDEG